MPSSCIICRRKASEYISLHRFPHTAHTFFSCRHHGTLPAAAPVSVQCSVRVRTVRILRIFVCVVTMPRLCHRKTIYFPRLKAVRFRHAQRMAKPYSCEPRKGIVIVGYRRRWLQARLVSYLYPGNSVW